jgi:hypothetical protein
LGRSVNGNAVSRRLKIPGLDIYRETSYLHVLSVDIYRETSYLDVLSVDIYRETFSLWSPTALTEKHNILVTLS